MANTFSTAFLLLVFNNCSHKPITLKHIKSAALLLRAARELYPKVLPYASCFALYERGALRHKKTSEL
jgi:hypothetical protein